MSEAPRLLIQCVGNRLRGDDGAGPAVADRLRALGLGDWVSEYWGDGARLIQDWEGREAVFIVDAAQSGAEPGRIHLWDAGARALPRDLGLSSSHRLGVAEAVELARALGILPRILRVYAIETECHAEGSGLSDAVATAVMRLADELRAESALGR